MKILRRFGLAHAGTEGQNPADTAPENTGSASGAPSSLEHILQIQEVSNAEFFVGDLFRRCFHDSLPNYPRHYVAFYGPDSLKFQAVGYVHYTAFEGAYLCGGLCIDDRAYRRIPEQHRRLIKAAGGIAEQLLRYTFRDLVAAAALFGYVGDTRSERVNLRVGFQHTGIEHLIVHWNKPLPDSEKAAWLRKIAALGPF